MIIIFSVAGAMVPLGIYGLLPVIAVLIQAGYDHRTVLPIIVSNSVFNMLVPFYDAGFIWRTGFRQVLLAVMMGITVGLLLRVLKARDRNLFKDHNLRIESGKMNFLLIAVFIAVGCIGVAGIYLIFGALADVTFNKYLLPGAMNFVFTNSSTSFIPQYFSRHDISSPSFLLVLTLAAMLMDLTRWSACLAMLKLRGFVLYLGCFIIWIVSLALPAFLK